MKIIPSTAIGVPVLQPTPREIAFLLACRKLDRNTRELMEALAQSCIDDGVHLHCKPANLRLIGGVQ
ncbi:MAG: hypothetical protein V4805_17625 [Pseudomonadota bacterium]